MSGVKLRLKLLKLRWNRFLDEQVSRLRQWEREYSFYILFGKISFILLKYLFIFTLPFILLIRGSVYLHEKFSLYSWISLLGGMILAAAVIFIYVTLFRGKLSGRLGRQEDLSSSWIFSGLIVFGYCMYGLIFLSGTNAKTESVRQEYHRLHPILRMAISTLVFLDEDLIITDASRKPEDYRKMGLKTKSRSLHYVQSSGYAHAIDIRTNNRNFIRNFFTKLYFRLMGFNTLRHYGTADHLHVSLSSKDIPGGI